jgi:hypothetical protein
MEVGLGVLQLVSHREIVLVCFLLFLKLLCTHEWDAQRDDLANYEIGSKRSIKNGR